MFYAVSLLTGFVVLHFAQVLDLYLRVQVYVFCDCPRYYTHVLTYLCSYKV